MHVVEVAFGRHRELLRTRLHGRYTPQRAHDVTFGLL